ncbi:MAG TPA: serine hydrolase, partial [Pseudomonadales bacterium]|nr:serine hydrolase [Pseudomonadales bacterium]
MTIKKLLLTCMLASAPLIGLAEVSQESLSQSLPASVTQVIQPLQLDASKLSLSSAHSMVFDLSSNTPVYRKNETAVVPIASITKLMTAMVVLDAKLPMDEVLTVEEADKDWLKKTHSRMRVGTQLSRYELMRLALMSSENRAAAALGRNYPGGLQAFVRAMNAKAQSLHMTHSHFQDSTGLSSGNVSTAEDLVKMVTAASSYPE